eukprot:scaffold288190_cov26-Tisochrysis_lutea.AAC.1
MNPRTAKVERWPVSSVCLFGGAAREIYACSTACIPPDPIPCNNRATSTSGTREGVRHSADDGNEDAQDEGALGADACRECTDDERADRLAHRVDGHHPGVEASARTQPTQVEPQRGHYE